MTKKPTKKTKNIINIVFLLVLIGVTLTVVFAANDINLHDIGRFLSNSNPWYIVAAFGGLIGFIVFEAISLHLISRKLGHKGKFTSSVAYTTADLYYSAITPSASGGQPASAFYMMRDGMSGAAAGFTVLLNIIAYTVATILVGLFGVIACPGMFGQIGHWFAQTLVIIGFVIQLLLLALLLLCLFRARVILAIGNFGITVLAKIKIVKQVDKWRTRLENMVNKYRSCRTVIKKHPMLFFVSLLLNIAQRTSQTLIPCFVIMASGDAAQYDVTFLELFCMQAYVMIGYNSIPLPGGTGVYEYLYPNIYGIGGYDMKFVLSAMMVSRAISYYICMIVTGLYTLVYHAVGLRRSGKADDVPEDVDIYSALGSEAVISAIVNDGDKKANGDGQTDADNKTDADNGDGNAQSENNAAAADGADNDGADERSDEAEQTTTGDDHGRKDR